MINECIYICQYPLWKYLELYIVLLEGREKGRFIGKHPSIIGVSQFQRLSSPSNLDLLPLITSKHHSPSKLRSKPKKIKAFTYLLHSIVWECTCQMYFVWHGAIKFIMTLSHRENCITRLIFNNHDMFIVKSIHVLYIEGLIRSYILYELKFDYAFYISTCNQRRKD